MRWMVTIGGLAVLAGGLPACADEEPEDTTENDVDADVDTDADTDGVEIAYDDGVAEELKVFVENLKGITSMVTSDHIMNLLEEITGRLPEDKERMLEVIRMYQELPETERLIYRIGRRGGAFRSTQDLGRRPDACAPSG